MYDFIHTSTIIERCLTYRAIPNITVFTVKCASSCIFVAFDALLYSVFSLQDVYINAQTIRWSKSTL